MPQRGHKTFGGKIASKLKQQRRITLNENFQQNLTTFKNHYHRGFRHFLGGKCPLGRQKNFWGR